MRGGSQLPAPRRIDTRDQNLAIGEFQQLRAGPGMQRGGKTLRAENDLFPGSFERVGHREIIADGALPSFEHVYIIKCLATYGRAASPAEISVGFAERGRHSAIPRGRKAARQ